MRHCWENMRTGSEVKRHFYLFTYIHINADNKYVCLQSQSILRYALTPLLCGFANRYAGSLPR